MYKQLVFLLNNANKNGIIYLNLLKFYNYPITNNKQLIKSYLSSKLKLMNIILEDHKHKF